MATGAPGDGRGVPTVWQDFRRRRVIRTTLAYLSLTVLAIEAYPFGDQMLALPDWGLRAVIGVAVLGFPIMIVLSWTYDVTPGGIVRTPESPETEPPPVGSGRRWLAITVGSLLAAGALRLVHLWAR